MPGRVVAIIDTTGFFVVGVRAVLLDVILR